MRGLRRIAVGCLNRLERVSRRARQAIDNTQRGRPGHNEVPTAADWEACVRIWQPTGPVQTIDSPAALAMMDVTARGEAVLEVGCGSGALSAQLALGGRQIHLCDLSKPILDGAVELFAVSGLPAPNAFVCDVTAGIPLDDNAVDVVWSCGLLEHWPDEEIAPMVREMRRVAKRAVVSLVPNALCVVYRSGKAVAEQTGVWPFGRELPRVTLAPVFEQAGLMDITECSLDPAAAVDTLLLSQGPVRHAPELRAALTQLFQEDPNYARQGYLLLTVGKKVATEVADE